MYPKNLASPPKLFATVVKASDGTAITADVAAKYSTGAGSQAAGGGTCQHEGNGQWSYAPTQAETNVAAFGIQFYHADAVGSGPTISVVTETGVNLTAIPWNADWDAQVQSEVDDALVAQKLDHLVAVADADDVANDSIIAKLASKAATADWSGYVNTTDSLEAVRDRGDTAWITAVGFSTHSAADVKTAVEADGSKLDHLWEMTEDDGGVRRLTANALEEGPVGTGTSTLSSQDVRDAMKLAPTAGDPAAGSVDKHLDDLITDVDDVQTRLGTIAPTTDAADSFTINSAKGTEITGTYVKTQTDDNDRHSLAPVNPGGLDVTYVFQCGTGRAPTAVGINGYWNGSSQYCDVYAYDYALGIWDKLSNTSTYMASRNSDSNYVYGLNREHMDLEGTPGNVSIRFVSASTNTAHRLHLDRVLVNTVSDSTGGAGAGGGLTAQQVWEYVVRTLTATSGEPIDTDGIANAVWDEANADHVATGSVGKALSDINTNVTDVHTDVGTLLTRIPAALFAGITSLAKWLQLFARKDAAIATDNATELGEINANMGTGAGAYASTTDSQEAIRDNPVTLASTQGAVTFGQVKIAANVASEGALDIANANAAGYGTRNVGGSTGDYNYGEAAYGQYNRGAFTGQYNAGVDVAGQINLGGTDGQLNAGTSNYGIEATGGTAPTSPAWGGGTGGAALTAQEVRDSMKLAPTAGSPAAGSVDKHLDDLPTDIDTLLTASHGTGSWGTAMGTKSVVYTVTVGGLPEAGVYCRMTTDAAGAVNVDAGDTDSSGQVTFHHDLATGVTVYIWRSKDGVTFVDPDIEVIPA